MSWGCDTHLYPTFRSLREAFLRCLAAGERRVLKKDRGNGGNGVWKVGLLSPARGGAPSPAPDTRLNVRHGKHGTREKEHSIGGFLRCCEPYFAGNGPVIGRARQHTQLHS